MAFRDYFDVEFFALNAKHVSGALVAILGFSLVRWVSERVMETGWVLWIIHVLDNIVVTSCIIFLSIVILLEIGKKLWKALRGLFNGGTSSVLVA